MPKTERAVFALNSRIAPGAPIVPSTCVRAPRHGDISRPVIRRSIGGGGGGYNGEVFATLIIIAATFTLGAAITLVGAWRAEPGAWRAELRVVAATVVSLLAGVSVLVLAVAINSRG